MTEAASEDPLGPEPYGGETVEGARYRQVLGHFATGVTVVTAIDAERKKPVGLSVNSFASVSLDPPLVAFCAARTSATWPRIRTAGSVSVNVLAEDQEHLSRAFALRGADKFRGVGWRPSRSGAPLLDGALAWLDCTIEAEHDAGDHVLVVARVRELDVARETGPLIFYRGGYGRFGS